MLRELNSDDVTVDVVIPVLNEAHVLKTSVATVRDFLKDNLPYQWKVVIVDNGSTDGTFEIAKALASVHRDVEFVFLEERGRGRALRKAWQSSTADIVLYTDVDLSTELAALPKVVNALVDNDYDIAIGSRLTKSSRTKRSLKREITSRTYNFLLKCIFFTKFTDAQCGFKAVTRQIVDEIVPEVRDEYWFFDTELLILAEKRGCKIKDIPVRWVEDDDSRVKLISDSWRMLRNVFRLRYSITKDQFMNIRIFRGRKSPDDSAIEPVSNLPD